MKTRSNMPLFVVECDDITKLNDGQIDLLRCGDYLVKRTGKQRHAYKVSYKEDKQGMCLTYTDASTVETVSYDFTNGHWVYNSTDKSVLPVNGDAPYFEDITDKDGHKRFIEGDVNISNTLPEGCSKIYGKWSLSGSHLMIVFAIAFANGTEIPNGNNDFANLTLPKWVYDKIEPTIGSSVIEITSVNAYDASANTQNLNNISLTKSATEGKLDIKKYNGLTFTSDKIARLSFDLLIDNE